MQQRCRPLNTFTKSTTTEFVCTNSSATQHFHKINNNRICLYQQFSHTTLSQNQQQQNLFVPTVQPHNTFTKSTTTEFVCTNSSATQHFHKINNNRICLYQQFSHTTLSQNQQQQNLFVPAVQPHSHTSTNREESECNNRKKTRHTGVQFLNP